MSLQMHDHSTFVLNAMEDLSLTIALAFQQERYARKQPWSQDPQSSQVA